MNSVIISLHDLLGTFRSRLEAPGLEPDALTAISRWTGPLKISRPPRPARGRTERASTPMRGVASGTWPATPSPFSATPGSSARGRNHGPAKPIGEHAAISRSSNKPLLRADGVRGHETWPLTDGPRRVIQEKCSLSRKPIRKRDAAGQGRTRKTKHAPGVATALLRRGHRTQVRPPEMPETGVVVLITQRSQVQILPPLPFMQVRGLC